MMHEHDNLKGTRGGDRDRIPRTLSIKTIVIVMEVAAKHEPAKDYKKLALSRQWKNQALAANSQKPTSERRLLFIISFKDTYIYYYICTNILA
jgi:hypothetical protein